MADLFGSIDDIVLSEESVGLFGYLMEKILIPGSVVLMFLIPISYFLYRCFGKSSHCDDKRKKGKDVITCDVKKTHLWGYADTDFIRTSKDVVCLTSNHYQIAGKSIPKLMKFFMNITGLTHADIDKKPEMMDLKKIYERVEQYKMDMGRTEQLMNVFKSVPNVMEHLSFSGKDIMIVSVGQTNLELVCFHYIDPTKCYLLDETVDAVFRPQTEEQIIDFMKTVVQYNSIDHQQQIKLIPRGGGTNVTRCLVVERSSERQIIERFISVDMSSYCGIISCDKMNTVAKFKAGTTGKQLEYELEKLGFMCGHEPDSVEFSTLGGWIATNASGMKRNRYGNIEDFVLSMDIICPMYPDRIITVGHDLRTSSGPDVSRLIFGSEGACVIIVNASIKIRQLPEQKIYDSYVVPDWETGTRFLREVQKSGQLPASLRMVDNPQFQFGQALKPAKSFMGEMMSYIQKKLLVALGYNLSKICACTIVYEGGKDECSSIKTRMNKIAKRYGIMSGGSENGEAGYNLTNAIAYIRDFADTMHVFGDTYEITVNWSNVATAGQIITDNLNKTHARLKQGREDILRGKMFVSYRATQLYETGVCVYFTYAYYCHNFEQIETIQKEIETTLKESANQIGATLSHHHGIGKLKKDAYKKRYPHVEDVTKGMKTCFDPNGVVCPRNNWF